MFSFVNREGERERKTEREREREKEKQYFIHLPFMHSPYMFVDTLKYLQGYKADD